MKGRKDARSQFAILYDEKMQIDKRLELTEFNLRSRFFNHMFKLSHFFFTVVLG